MIAQLEMPLAVGCYSGNDPLQIQIRDAFIALVPMEMRTRARRMDFLKTELLKAGKDVFPAVEDAGGNCIFCGEAGRCFGWHYYGEK